MAETAKILNPDKLVLLPDLDAGCSLADSCPPDEFAAFKAAHPDHLVVSYINCSAETKAMSDIICTSSNAVRIIQQIPEEQPIIFAPDRNLGRYVMQQTNGNVSQAAKRAKKERRSLDRLLLKYGFNKSDFRKAD